jgi:beta-N-acetylhexosaminidase
MGRITALEGRALGIHIGFAPVLDVNNNPANPVINTRAFGEDPVQVARFGAAFIRGMQSHGMLATGKHFPGHGDTGINSHLALPVVNASRARLDSVELPPFRAAVRAGVGAIMTFHGAMPALDSTGVPGTLSRPVLTGLLREGMGFDGLIITDAMDMRGVLDMFGAKEASIRAVAAGSDVLLMPSDVPGAIDAVVEGVRTGRYDEARLDSSVKRILAAKHALGLERRRLVDLDGVRAVVGDSSHEAVAQLAAERSITLVKDSLRQLPLGRFTRGARVLSVTYSRRPDLAAGVTFDSELRRQFPTLRSEFVDAASPVFDLQRILQVADSADIVIVGSYVSHSWSATTVAAPRAFVDFVEELRRRGRPPVVVAFGNPYLLQQIPEVAAYVVAWGGFPVSQRAAARALLGAAPIGGRLPISIPPVAHRGAGESRPALQRAAAQGAR